MASELPVLVTGACGRLGGQIVQRLVAQGRPVLATDRVPAPANAASLWGGAPSSSSKFEFVQAELADHAAIQALAARCGDAVHVAALPGPSSHPPPGVDKACVARIPIGLERETGLELLQLNLMGTGNLFEAFAQTQGGTSHRRIVFSSSLFAMGWSHDATTFRPLYLPVDEAHPPLPCEHYGLSKAMAEDLAKMIARAAEGSCGADGDAKGKAVGQNGGSGPPLAKRQRLAVGGTSFISLRFSNIVKEEKWAELPWAAPEHPLTALMWAYTHEHDVVEAHLAALALPRERLPSSCESFLIAADDTRFSVPTADLIDGQWRAHPAGVPPLRRALPGFTSIVCSNKAKRLLGFNPRSFRSPAPERLLSSTCRSWSEFKPPPGFLLKGGSQLPDVARLAYKTYGSLNADRSNVILHPTSFDAVHWELEFNVGPGLVLDTDKYFVIIVNLLGNGVSFSPHVADDAQCVPTHFPADGMSMCDNVRLQALLLNSLKIEKLALIYGYSMGAMQALHWGVMYPDRVLRIAAVCGAARASDYNIVFLDSLRGALLADPGCVEDGEGRVHLFGSCTRGLKAFARIYAGWGVPMQFYRDELWRQSSRDGLPFTSREDFVVRSYEGGFANAHPLNLLAQLQTWRSADVSTCHGLPKGTTLADALGRISARVYMMPSTTDSYFTVPEIEEEAKLIPRCRCVPLESHWGHRAGDTHRPGQEADAKVLKARVAELLEQEPAAFPPMPDTVASAPVAGAEARAAWPNARVAFENTRLRISELCVPLGEQAVVQHPFPTVRWQVLSATDRTPMPCFYPAGTELKVQAIGAEHREYIFEVLQEPKYSEDKVQSLLDAAKYSVKVGTKLMLENKYLRMWDLRLPPGGGDRNDFHQHVMDNAFVLLDLTTAFAFVPAAAAGVSYRSALRFKPGQVVWTAVSNGGFDASGQPLLGDAVHSLENGSQTSQFREYYIELK